MDIALKQRLVGASVLIALAVVVLPMLLGGRPEGEATRTTRIEVSEPPEEIDFTVRRYPIGEQSAVETPPPPPAKLDLPAPQANDPVQPEPPAAEPGLAEAVPDESGDPAATAAKAEESVPPPAVAEAEPEPEPEPESEAAPAVAEPPTVAPRTAPAASPSGRYVVQVASFGSVGNARKLAEKLGGLGYSVLTDTVSADVGTLNRVRVGPYGSEAEAQRAVARLRDQVDGSKPRVMDLQPGGSERVTEPSDPLVRWVVQVGSFSSEANADGLVAKLRLEGLSAYRETVSGAGGTVYRVRVGPYVERDEAIRADRLIGDRLAIDGVVMSAD